MKKVTSLLMVVIVLSQCQLFSPKAKYEVTGSAASVVEVGRDDTVMIQAP